MNQLEANGVIRMASLGRPFTMGMLYDCRKDTLVPGMTLWDNATLKSALNSTPQVGTGFTIIAEDSLDNKANELNVNASLKLSFMGGLVEVKGAAKYLDNRTSSVQQSRVSLKHWSTTRFDQLTMEQLGNIKHKNVFSKKIATHVVIGIVYGADAFFIFDRKFKDGENKRTVDGSMQVLIKALPGITEIKGDAKVEFSQKDKEVASKLECTFHGDLRLPSNPTTFESAVKIYQQLPELMQEDKAVPKTVWLYPLTELNSKAAKVVHDISIGLVNEAQKVMEEMFQLEIQANDLINAEACSLFSGLQQQLANFKSRITEYKMFCSKKLNQLLPNIRGGGKDESLLADFFKSKESSESPFSTQHLSTWIKAKQQEIKVIGTHLQAMQKIKNVKLAFVPGDLDAFVTDLNYDYIVCFSFKLFANDDQFLQQMSEFLQDKVSSTVSLQSQSQWLKNKKLMTTMREKVRQFTAFANANEGKEKTLFVVTDDDGTEHDDGAEILLYENGLQDGFSPPYTPTKLTSESDITYHSVKLVWCKPEFGSDSVEHYTASYKLKNSAKDSWKTKMTRGKENFLIVENLQAETVYQFKVRAECEVGVSEYSDLVQIATLSSPVSRLADVLRIASTPISDEDAPQSLSLLELPKKEIFKLSKKKICKVEIGTPPIMLVEHKVLMVVGATGAGKSTLINGMINYIFGVQWKDDFRFKLIVDKVKTQAKSVTSEITSYTIYHMDGARIPYSLTIIDTPGFGDTSGIERDKEITEQIKEFFSLAGDSGINHLNGIGFVTQSALVRLTPTQQYIFDSILSVFGKDVEKNIFVMVTFCDGQKPPVVTAIKDADIPCSEFFKFNNSALYADNSCSENGVGDDDNFDEMFWKMGVSSFKKFFVSFEKAERTSLVQTRNVLSQREKLETAVMGLQNQMNECLGKMEIIRQHKLVLIKYEAQIIANKDFTFSITIPYYETIKLNPGQYVTNCLYCNTTCHFPCAYSDNDDKQYCGAMSNRGSSATCDACKNHCSWKMHKNTGERFELRQKTEIQNKDDLKKNYDNASSGKSSYETMIDNSQSQLEDAHANLHLLVEQARECLKILSDIALKPNPLSQMDYIQLLIDSETKLARDGWHDRVQYLEKAKDQAAILALVDEDRDIDARIAEEKSNQTQGWRMRVDKLEQVRRIKHAVDENRAKKKKGVLGHFVDAGKSLIGWKK